MKKILYLLTSLFLVLLISCDSSNNISFNDIPKENSINKNLSDLIRSKSCAEVEEEIKNNLILEMESQIDAKLERVLENYITPCIHYEIGIAYDGAAVNTVTSHESAAEYSETNNQVIGVDEADFIKNDGSYIYILSGGKFNIIDAWPPEEARIISSVVIDGTPKKLFVHNNMAVIYSSLDSTDETEIQFNRKIMSNSWECTYGYDCDFTGDGKILKITCFDISNIKHPELLRETIFSGSYLNSRRIGDVVYTAVIFPEINIDGVNYWPNEIYPWSYCWADIIFNEDEIIEIFEALKNKNKEIISNADISDFLPTIKDIRHINGEAVIDDGVITDCNNFYLSQAGDGRSFLSIISFMIDKIDPLSATTIMGKPGAVYANHNSLFIASRHYNYATPIWYFEASEGISEATTIHKFRLFSDAVGTEYAGSGVVKGKILNQFSMDDHNNCLRIATTTRHVPDSIVYNTITALKEKDNKLNIIGVIDNIAPTEDIRSVRFNGDKVFVVTFKKTDPLFVFNFSEPSNPIKEGELKIPGYSTYMHLIDDNHLLTIGYDTDEQGSFAWFQGIMLQVFDVTDPANLKLMHKEIIGTRGSSSEAATNHLAFNYFAQRDLLAIPMVICVGSDGGGSFYDNIMSFSGLMVYNVSINDGFKYLGGIPHEEPERPGTYCNACCNWWTRSNSRVKRSIFMDDYVYSVALDSINISHMESLDKIIKHIKLIDDEK